MRANIVGISVELLDDDLVWGVFLLSCSKLKNRPVPMCVKFACVLAVSFVARVAFN